jgi:hypothetical protein
MKWRTVLGVLAAVMVLAITGVALECQAGALVFEDKFATMDPAWGSPTDRQFVKDGVFVIQPEASRGWYVLNQANLFNEADIQCKVRVAKTEDQGHGGGIVFWAKDYSDYYALLIAPSGWFTVTRWTGGRFLAPVAWRETDAVKKGVGEWNELRVVAKGNEAKITINGKEVITFKGQPPPGGWLVGLRGNSPDKSEARWEFSDLKVFQP